MENRSLVTIAEHSKEKIMYLLEMAREFEKKPNRRLLAEKVVATLFFEPSTRTRLSLKRQPIAWEQESSDLLIRR